MGKGFMRISYLVLLVAAFFFYVLYNRPLSAVVLAFVGLMPLALLTLLALEWLGLRARGVEEVKGGVLKIGFRNFLPIPIGYGEALFHYQHHYLGKVESQRTALPVIPMGRETVECKMDSQCCGRVSCTLKSIRFQDPLRLFTFSKKVNYTWEFTISPRVEAIELKAAIFDKEESESDDFSKFSPGEDSSEVFDLRTYRMGDRLNRVHWKQSSRMGNGEMLVKEFSLPIERSLVVVLEFDAKEGPGYMASINALVERALGISQWLVEKRIPHTAAVCGREGMVCRDIENQQGLEAYMTELMFQKPRQTGNQVGLELLEGAFGSDGKSVFGACYIKSGELEGQWNLKEYFLESEEKKPEVKKPKSKSKSKSPPSEPDIHLYITPVSAAGTGIRG